MDEQEQAWKELEQDLALYQFYLELILKSAAVVLLMTGAIASYYLANVTRPYLKLALWLPVLVNAGMSAICIISIRFVNTFQHEHIQICRRAGINEPYELGLLGLLLKLMAAVYAVVFFGTLAAALGFVV